MKDKIDELVHAKRDKVNWRDLVQDWPMGHLLD